MDKIFNRNPRNGPCLRFEPEGLLRPQDSGIFRDGKLTERWQESLLPAAWLVGPSASHEILFTSKGMTSLES